MADYQSTAKQEQGEANRAEEEAVEEAAAELTDDKVIQTTESYMTWFKKAFEDGNLSRDAVRDYDRMARLREYLLDRRQEKDRYRKRGDGLPTLEELQRVHEVVKTADAAIDRLRQNGYIVLKPPFGDKKKTFESPLDGGVIQDDIPPFGLTGSDWASAEPAKLRGDELRVWAQI